jgi:hypothetical protein
MDGADNTSHKDQMGIQGSLDRDRDGGVALLGTGKARSSQLKRCDRTLAFFVLALQGSDIVVELRNQVFLRGTLYMADIHMKYENVLTLVITMFFYVLLELYTAGI